jgi:uncharacterized membrane protein
VLSFIFIGIYWGNHHHLLHTINHVNGKIIWANLHLLFWLSLIPFATGWMGENHFAQNTVVVYSILMIFCGIAYTILLRVIVSGHAHDTALEGPLKKQAGKGTISLVIYALAIVAAFVNPLISGILFVLVAVFWLLPDRNIEKSV